MGVKGPKRQDWLPVLHEAAGGPHDGFNALLSPF